MKKFFSISLFLAALSAMSGYLLSKASLIGRVGISLFYSEYGFLKIWWQGALIVFCGLLVILVLHLLLQRALKPISATVAFIISLFLAIGGLYNTYSDFRNDLSHRLLGERFHLGAYLFWIGWICISLSYLFGKKGTKAKQPTPQNDQPAKDLGQS